jgi:hypothetical protein
VQKVEKHRSILKNKNSDTILKSSMNRENLLKEYQERSNCEGLRNSKTTLSIYGAMTILKPITTKIKIILLKISEI